jgi:hypothetical protein
MSEADIGAGKRWSPAIAKALADSKVGIFCVTPENQHSPWLLFEAGAVAKTIEDTIVCPYLIDMAPADLEKGPLTEFQAKMANQKGTLELVSAINKALGDRKLEPDRLERQFALHWPTLDRRLRELPSPSEKAKPRPTEELVAEILDIVRGIARRTPEPPTLIESLDAKARQALQNDWAMVDFLVREYDLSGQDGDDLLNMRRKGAVLNTLRTEAASRWRKAALAKDDGLHMPPATEGGDGAAEAKD